MVDLALEGVLWIFVLISYVTMLLFIGLGVLFGWRKGQKGILIRFGATGGAALLAFVITRCLRNAFSGILSSLVFDLLDSGMNTRALERLIESAGTLSALIEVLIGAMVLPMVFTVLFVIFQLIATIVCSIAARKVVREETKMGMLFGALRGLVIALILLFPSISLRSYAETVISSHDLAKEAAYETLGEDMVDTLKDTLSADVPYLLTRRSVVPVMVNGLSSVPLEDYTMTVYRAIEGLPVVLDAADLFFDSETDFTRLDNDVEANFHEVLDGVEDSEFLRHLLAELLVPAAEKWAEGKQFLELSGPPLGSPDGQMWNIYRNVYIALSESDANSIVKNLRALLKVAAAIGDISTDYAGMSLSEALMQDGNLDKLLQPLRENQNMKSVVASIVDLSIRTLADNVFAEETGDSEEAYDFFMDELERVVNDNMNDPVKVQKELHEMAADHDITIPDDMMQSFSESLVKELERSGGVLNEEVMDNLFLEFADEYAILTEQNPSSGIGS